MNFSGCYTAVITPFNLDGSVDFVAFEKILESQISGGIDGLVVLGTTGESPTVSNAEHDEIITRAVEIVNGRTLIIAGTGSNCTQEAIDRSVHAQEAGVDALLQVTPYYNKPTQEGIYAHFKTIAQAVDIPIILYNVASRCGVNIDTRTVVDLAKIPNIIGIKEASGDLNQVRDIIHQTSDDFIVLSGNDDQTLDIIRLGGHGVISVVSNILPKEMTQFVELALEKEGLKADEINKKLTPLFRDCFIESNPQPIKTLMAHEGFCEVVFRLPLVSMNESNKVKLLATWGEVKSSL